MVGFGLSCIPSVISLVISPVRTSDEEADRDRYHAPLSPARQFIQAYEQSRSECEQKFRGTILGDAAYPRRDC
jgi:hypothetical protein